MTSKRPTRGVDRLQGEVVQPRPNLSNDEEREKLIREGEKRDECILTGRKYRIEPFYYDTTPLDPDEDPNEPYTYELQEQLIIEDRTYQNWFPTGEAFDDKENAIARKQELEQRVELDKALNEIEGVGPKVIISLIDQFESTESVLRTTKQELKSADLIGPVIAQQIHEHNQNNPKITNHAE